MKKRPGQFLHPQAFGEHGRNHDHEKPRQHGTHHDECAQNAQDAVLHTAPVLEKLAAFYGDKLAVYKVNVDNDIDLARQFNVVSIPSLFLLKDGEVVNSTMGFQNLEALKNFVESGL